jgi:hypothetical protein
MLKKKGESMKPCGRSALIGAIPDVDEYNFT